MGDNVPDSRFAGSRSVRLALAREPSLTGWKFTVKTARRWCRFRGLPKRLHFDSLLSVNPQNVHLYTRLETPSSPNTSSGALDSICHPGWRHFGHDPAPGWAARAGDSSLTG